MKSARLPKPHALTAGIGFRMTLAVPHCSCIQAACTGFCPCGSDSIAAARVFRRNFSLGYSRTHFLSTSKP